MISERDEADTGRDGLSEGQRRAITMPLLGLAGAGAGVGAGYLAAKSVFPGSTNALFSPGTTFLKNLAIPGAAAALSALGLHESGAGTGQIIDHLLARGVLPAAVGAALDVRKSAYRAGIPMALGALIGGGLGMVGGYQLGGGH